MPKSEDEQNKAKSDKIGQAIENVCFSYLPAIGAISHTVFAIHILDKSLIPRFFPVWHFGVANSFLFNSHLGVGLYLYNSRCLSKAPVHNRILWSVYGSVLFNFGSVLLFSTGKLLLVNDRLIGALYAAAASLSFLVIGKQYVEFVDENIDG
ncbi:hypothetical protein BSL78_14857 [Apostichopus japonicus]|uniref:Transmembrane protein n=1 Tax=Stichopus japonicus TaxID=307972 RepID=A0A2G8KJU5_STIJA|nr:hypothetical protein BSL78_14857 [Apostichopus japonicus]